MNREKDENLCEYCQLEPVLFLGISTRCEDCWADYIYEEDMKDLR